MKKLTTSKLFGPCLLAIALILSGAGCATPESHSYNADFNQNLTSAPRYIVTSVNDDKFKINLHQGQMVSGEARVLDIRNAATVIAKNEATKRGWENWDLNLIREANEGWQHVAVAEVTRKNGIRFNAAPGQP